MKKEIIKYSDDFKLTVIKLLEDETFESIEAARRMFNIKGSSIISRWIKKFGKNHLLGKIVRIEMPDEIDQLKRLQKEQSELESALAKAHLKILSLESIIESAEKYLGIELKKVPPKSNHQIS